jgi:exodeoxyribonuclease-3
MKITTWNVNSVNARLPLIHKWVEAEQPDVVAFQEIKCIDEKFPTEAFESLGYQCAVHGQKSYNGVAILSRHGLSDIQRGLGGDQSDTASRYLEALIEAPRPFRFASVYLPNGNPIGTEKFTYKMNWLERLQARALELLMLEETTVLSGDYNIIPYAEDCHNPAVWLDDALFQPEVRRAFQGLKNLGYTDAFQAMPPEGNRYTFWDYQAGAWQKNEGIRIDHHMLSPQAADRLEGLIIHKDVRGVAMDEAKPSDHVPVTVVLTD